MTEVCVSSDSASACSCVCVFISVLASMAILAVGMARLIIHSAFTAPRYVAAAIWSPASLFGDPADFCPAHQTADPITTVFFLDDDVTPRTFHGLSIL